jgi:hypothetical protein
MGIRRSKAALADAAELLGTSKADARVYLRRIQQIAGEPIPYATIVRAMRGDIQQELDVIATAATELHRTAAE